MKFMPHWPLSSMRSNIKYDLDRIFSILGFLGNPQDKLPPVVHIAGTNGKGSTLAILEYILRDAGYIIHKYTSPHLLYFNERISLSSSPIDDDYLYSILERVRLVCEKNGIEPSFFEATTAAAYLAFSEVPADILLLETGMGGRLDATNVLKNPFLTIISTISYDHMEYLGNDLRLIAAEKAGIMKPGSPCVISAQVQEVMDVLFDHYIKINNGSEEGLFAFSYDYSVSLKNEHFFSYLTPNSSSDYQIPALPGEHQIINAASAIASVNFLRAKFTITDENIDNGLKKVKWFGRITKINQGKFLSVLNKDDEIWLDGAHNEGGAQVLSEWLKKKNAHNNYECFLITGFTKGRKHDKFWSYFDGLAKYIFSVVVKSEASSYSYSQLNEAVLNLPNKNSQYKIFEFLEEALTEISNNSSGKPKIIIITGSLYLISDFLKIN